MNKTETPATPLPVRSNSGLGDTLLPCPFCGRQPELVELDKQVSNPENHRPVKCLTVGCPMHYIYPDIKVWNKRAIVSPNAKVSGAGTASAGLPG